MSRIATADLYTTTTAREMIGFGTARREETVLTHTTPCRRSRSFVQLSGDTFVAVCNRCGGTGDHVSELDGHRCWNCNKVGVKGRDISRTEMDRLVRNWAMSKRREEAKRRNDMAAREIDRAAWRACHTDLITWAESLTPTETRPADDWQPEFHTFGLYRNGDALVNNLLHGYKLDARETAFLYTLRERHIADAAAAQVSRHAAEIGTKTTITGTVRVAREIETTYGYHTKYSNFLVITGTGEYAGITWTMFTTAAGSGALNSGDTVTVTATIKDHGEYKGAKQDKVVRPKFVTA